MNRVRPIEALLAALASFTVALPLLTLFDSNTWVRPSIVIVATIALVGLGLRSLVASAWPVIAGQAVAGFLAISWMHGQGHLSGGLLPGPDTVQTLGILLGEARDTVMAYSAPAPTERGVIVAITILVGLTALIVDAIAVTLRSPALAGLALLTAYLVSATNSGEGLSWKYFVAPIGFWFALLATQGLGTVRRWSTAVPRGVDGEDHDPVLGVASTARLLSAATLALAVVLPMVVPHLPTTFIADGLGRSDNARGGGGAVTLNTTIDLRRSLESQSQSPVLSYTTTATSPDPLRVGVLTDYRHGEWSTGLAANENFAGGPENQVADPSIKRTNVQVKVTENRLRVPQIALPTPLLNVDVGDQPLRSNFVGGYAIDQKVDDYTATYSQFAPNDTDFSGTEPRPPGWDEGLYSEIDGDGEGITRLATLVDTVVPEGSSPLETARLLQAHFRSSQYTYSLQLPTPTDSVSGRTMMSDPLSNFLLTRTGYCVQFASAFIMAARYKGIPARMAIGFLPGARDINGKTYVVKAADAHAWPELWFPDMGWTRFEPTPGTRTGGAPTYSLIPSETGPTASTAPTSSSAAPTPQASERPDPDAGALNNTTTRSTGPFAWLGNNLLALLVTAAIILSLLLLPVAAWLRRRRLRAAARDDAERVEADWASLISRLGDIGIAPPDGSTPRQAGARLTHDAILSGEPKQAMGRIVATVEQARYAPPQAPIADVSGDAKTVWKAAMSARQRGDQIRARLIPGDGVRQWIEVRDNVMRWPRDAWSRLRR